MKERKEKILSDAIRLAGLERAMYRVPARLVPVCVLNGSRSRETEEGSVRQGLNVLQYALQQCRV